jgi:hypothetical protein
MEPDAWPTPQTPSRDPLPRVEDLPVAEQGYEQESVKAAFDSFYRHAAQLDAALRTLEAVDSFHRHAASLRSDLRALRAAGWTQQSWTPPPSYGYGMRAPREGIPPAVWRISGEVLFLVAVAVALGVAKVSWWVILLAMAGAFAIVCALEWLAAREQFSSARSTEPAPVLPVVQAQRADDTDEHDALGWTAFEEAQEPSDAMTIIGAPPREEDVMPEVEVEAEAEREPEPEGQPEPEPEPEPELPPAAEESPAEEGKHWWQRRKGGDETADAQPDLPRHVRVLPPDENDGASDPWEQGFDGPRAEELEEEMDEQTDEDALVEEPQRRRFRRR